MCVRACVGIYDASVRRERVVYGRDGEGIGGIGRERRREKDGKRRVPRMCVFRGAQFRFFQPFPVETTPLRRRG